MEGTQATEQRLLEIKKTLDAQAKAFAQMINDLDKISSNLSKSAEILKINGRKVR
jgi:hypothetical protein